MTSKTRREFTFTHADGSVTRFATALELKLYDVVENLIGADEDDTWDTDREWLRNRARAALRAADGGTAR